ncbi:hypothetical protein CBR_g39786 [Chara braunii]|uniref:Uncharacterized protein n=1 Tax=Chara braunii TaxID=69332 RepID=A0A388LS97_CHABU|nr:hypothetical protein CBR_g39786 [Chara braunii]|eukprot:GBG85220.1 hypothetical protein CBR_g39786 [Chara braunii]
MEGTFSTPRVFESIFSTPQAMSAGTHIRLAEPFRPYAKSVRHFNGVTTIHRATAEDFDEDPWMTIVPCMDAHLDDWGEGNWDNMESHYPWANQYKFANMLEFGDLIPLPDVVLGHKFLNHMRKALSCISRYFSRLECHNVRSLPRTWGGSRKQELVECARRCSFLDQYPTSGHRHERSPGISPRALSYGCVRLTVSGSDFARVLCVAASNKSRKLVDAVVLVSHNEVVIEGSKFVPMRGSERVDGWPDLVIAGERRCLCQGAILDMCLLKGFEAGAANTSFYNDLRRQGGFVLGREFFDLLEDKDIALDVPCEVGPDLVLLMPLQSCGSCESSGAAGDGGDPGSEEATHVQRDDARGQFDDNEDEATPRPPFSPLRERDSLWLLTDQKEEEAIKKQNAALRSYLPLPMAGENVSKLAVKFFEKWETGRLLSHDGAKWIVKKKKVKNVKLGVAYIHNDKLGRTEVVYNVPMDPPNKKGKKEKEEGDWFVQVPDPDAHCWKTMESLTDNEKCHVLKKVLACEVVWVQADSPSLAKLGKLSVQDMVQLLKCDRVLVRLWSKADWIQRYPFLKSRSAVFKKFEGHGLDDKLWDNSRKHVSDSALFKDCPPYMGCDQDNSIEVTEKLAGHEKLPVNWRNKVLSVLNGSRLKSREVALAEGVIHIKWKDTGDVTSIASFANDPLEANIRGAELKEEVTATKSHTSLVAPERQGSFYGDMKRNPTQFVGRLDFLGKKGEGVVFLGKPHAQSVRELLKAGRHVVAMEGNPDLLQFAMQVVKSEVNSVLDNYHFASRMNAKAFIERLQSLYFVESEEQLKLASYTSLISTDDEEAIGVEFVSNVKEEESDTESIDLQYDPPPADHGRGSSSAVPSPSAAALVSPLAKPAPSTTSMKLLKRLRALATPPPALRPGSDKWWLELTEDYYELDTSPSKGVVDWNVPPPSGPDGGSGGGSSGSEGDGGGDAGGGKGIPPMGERGSHGRNTTLGGSAGVAGFAVDRTPSTGTRPERTTHYADPATSSVGSARDTLAALVALGSRFAGKPKSAGIRTTSGVEPPERSEMRRSGDMETTKSAEIRTSSGRVGRPGIVVPLRGAACTGTEGRSSRFSMGTAEGDEFRGREVGEKMEEQKGAQEGEEEGEEEVEGEEAGETELIDFFEGMEGAASGEDEVEHSEDDAGSGESSDEFGQLYGEHHEDNVDDDATTIEMETQVVSSLSAEPEDYAVRPLTSAVDLQHQFDEASVAIGLFEKSRRISIDEVIDGILGDHNVSARSSATANVVSSLEAALASSPPKSQVLPAILAAEGEGELGGGKHVMSPKKSRFGGQALDVLALPAPNSPSKERREKQLLLSALSFHLIEVSNYEPNGGGISKLSSAQVEVYLSPTERCYLASTFAMDYQVDQELQDRMIDDETDMV